MWKLTRWPAVLALVAAVLGLIFAGYSSYDYIQHIDRQLHAVHCSFVPGLAPVSEVDNACRTAMYSAYGALFRGTWWGGIPVSLFALGVYGFFAAFAIGLLVSGPNASRRAYQFMGYAALGPLLVSVFMAFVAAVKLGVFCKTCVGLYVSSMLLAAAGIWCMAVVRRVSFTAAFEAPNAPGPTGTAPLMTAPVVGMPVGHPAMIAAWLAGLGLCVALPALIYVNALPDVRPKLASCGSMPKADGKGLLHLASLHPKRDATIVADPLCPTCKAMHDRLAAEGALENLNISLALMPLDDECNWMLDRPLHPGSCVLSKAVLCADPRSREALEWMYRNQEELAGLAKAGGTLLRSRLRTQFGDAIDACIDAKKTDAQLNGMLQYAVTNQLPVSTPQLYLGNMRVCDEDTDLGLRYTLGQLAPELLQ